ncbi:TraV family lipoprotein [Novosphingobium sp. BL-52-GroH]|uniref:TraV family lipoprotein n=1 Tax=Novosphingobium sp. BL-52-GroH TaxID=3349877 RepID=UPI00384EA83A
MRGRLALAGLLLGSASLSGCMSLSGNVKGDFACRAPDGICAPSGNIDDRALAMISGDEGDHMIAPAGPYVEPPSEGRGYQKASSPVRTRERVLRIVFPAQIDASGRLHEQTAVHAVVERGEWSEALAGNAVAGTAEEVAAAAGRDTLLAAVERAEPPMIETLAVDPDLPTPEAVAMARAQGNGGEVQSSDPVGDIKDQVARSLTTPRRTRAAPSTPKPQRQAQPKPVAQAPATQPAPATPLSSASPAPAPKDGVAAQPVVAGPMISVPQHATAKGKAAIAAVEADPAIRGALGRAEPEARAAAKEASPLPVMRAGSFPGVQP